ncbi:cupin domain-containing protein [Paenibacillus pini]|uniref:Cupin domain protein n=1 Tax=Paenibacillus pini JCM 16418 TaxID=1236976 RepID=W7YL50_9BACL|nr:cupin domain-containing protein [Paenibacillus pini]GAF08468.1 Cupin domain protein [Paenibacillus pini JCM 16418]
MNSSDLQTYLYADDGLIPNHPTLPVLHYRGVMQRPAETEACFNKNGWLNSWTNGVFSYHHYHSNTHEVLGIIRGNAILQLGGSKGDQLKVQAGDVIVLPAGTGHKKCSASADFKVVGAYPDGMDYNVRTGEQGERPQVLEEITRVPLPTTDPVFGANGPLLHQWNSDLI